MNVSFKGFGEQILTFETEAELKAGVPVKVTDSGKVAACSDGEVFAGFTAAPSREGLAAVQVGGYVCVKYSGTAPAFNSTLVAADASGGIKAAAAAEGKTAAGREVLVAELDSAGGYVGIIL